MTSILFAAIALVSQAKAPDVLSGFGPYDASVPKPETILEYGAGERHTTFRDMELVVTDIAKAAKDRVQVFQYGKSWEGRPLRVLAISSPKNMAKLAEIRANLAKLADPKPGENYDSLIADTPPVVWINECIHGDETASFESGMWLLYNLAASRNREITDLLDRAVVVLNPVFNPDGHERFVVWYNAAAIGSPEPDAFEHAPPAFMRGRVNHYRFDMNRDHITLSQVETRTETAEIRRWNPQVYVDQHGQVESYFFPPNPMSINVNVDRVRLNKWTEILGKATAAAFDKRGWLYMVKNEFDFYAPNYTDTWATLNGAIGLTHETDHGASLRERRSDGSMATLKGAIDKHFTSALAVIDASGRRRTELLKDFLKYKLDAVTGKLAGKFQRVVVPVTRQSQGAVARLEEVLKRHGIRTARAAQATQLGKGTDFWTGDLVDVTVAPGSLIIDVSQAQAPLIKALLEPHSDFEEEFIAEQQRRREAVVEDPGDPDAGSYEFYDLTAWSLVYGFGIQAYWMDSAQPVKTQTLKEFMSSIAAPQGDWETREGSGYELPYNDSSDALLAAKLLAAGLIVHVPTRDLESGSEKVQAGSFVLYRDRNRPEFEKTIESAIGVEAKRLRSLATAYPSEGRYGLGSGWWQSLKKPKVGLYFGDRNSPSDFGATWFVLEKELGIEFTPITSQSLSGDLHDYTCLIFPGRAPALSGKLLAWVQEGGCAVVLGDSGWFNGSNGLPKLEPTAEDEPAPLPGSLFLGTLDARSFLSYGLPLNQKTGVSIAVPVNGSRYLKAAEDASSVLKLAGTPEEVKLLSGWIWPDETAKALAGSTWAQVNDVGRGRVVGFFWNPMERAMYPGHWQLVLNAMLFGPR